MTLGNSSPAYTPWPAKSCSVFWCNLTHGVWKRK